jgi:hypothetical protein
MELSLFQACATLLFTTETHLPLKKRLLLHKLSIKKYEKKTIVKLLIFILKIFKNAL